jgi:hypothetical protein
MLEVVGIIAVVILAIFVNGIIAKVEDESPGGFDNPKANWKDAFLKPRPHQLFIWAMGFVVIAWLIWVWATSHG